MWFWTGLLLFGCSAPDSEDRDQGLVPGGQDTDESEDTGTAPDTEGEDTGAAPDTDGEDSDSPATGSGGSGGPTGTGSASVGTVGYAYHVPACVSPEVPVPVVFTQHGAGGTGASMVAQWAPLADAQCFIVIGQGSESGNGWNFNGDVTGLSALIDEVDALWNVDVERRILHGYSAGAHWGYVIGMANSDVFGGLIVYAGAMSYAESYGVWPDGTQGPIPVAIGHGTEDAVVPYAYAQQAQSKLDAAGWPVELWTVDGGSHAYDPAHQQAAWSFLMGNVD